MIDLYFVSGMGANEKIFEQIKLEPQYNFRFIAWKQPLHNENIHAYALRMTEEIDQTKPFILIGLSFGGIMVQEMNRYVTPLKTILISSITDGSELSSFMKISQKTRLYQLIPTSFFTENSFLSYAFFRNLYFSKRKALSLDTFFTVRDSYYLKWAIHQILNWKNLQQIKNLYHIHGDKDLVFPHKQLKKSVILIPNGNHIMIYQKAKKVTEALRIVLKS